MEKQTLNCPVCGVEHAFRLEVDRSYVIYNMTTDMLNRPNPVKRFRRFFICPTNNKPFQATVAIEETFGTIVNDVKVLSDD